MVSRIEHNPIHLNEDGKRLDYVDAGEFARHLVELFDARRFSDIEAAFSVIERLHIEGDPYVRELATIGYPEGIQNIASHSQHVEAAEFERFLLPETRRWWEGLNRFWAGLSPTVLPAD